MRSKLRISARRLAVLRKRALTVVANSINSLVVPVFYIIISFLVIRAASVELWGAFVHWLVIVPLGAHIVSWGNKEYLLRAFSFTPGQIAQAWQTSFISRALLAIPTAFVLFALGDTLTQRLLLVSWGLGLILFQSYDVLIVYKKDFAFAAIVEVVTLTAMSLTVLALDKAIALNGLILLFGLLHWAKAIIYLIRYRTLTWGGQPGQIQIVGRLDFGYFQLAFPFFLLGFSGMLQSRIDLYAVNFFLTERDVAQYQIFINLMIYLQAVSAFILIPFVKSIYRLGHRSIQKISIRLFGFGLMILIPALVGVHFLLLYLYQFSLSPAFLICGGLFVLPIYFYLPIIYALYKADQQSMVLRINILGTALNFGLNLILLPRIGMLGAIAASAVSQWVMLGAYLIQNKGLQQDYAAIVPELS